MATRPDRYERLFPLGEQAKRNIGEGRVLLNMIRRGELPQGTTLAEAQEFGIDLSRRPRKGKRKKGLLPELTKKEYREQLGKKIKEFSTEEKRIYNALAQRERRGYVVNRASDQSLADELEDFLLEEDDGGGGEIVATIEDIPQEPQLQDVDDILATLPTADELPPPLEDLQLDFLPPPEEVVIPRGISSVVEREPVDEDTDTDTDTDEDDNIEFVSVLGRNIDEIEELRPPPPKRVRPSRRNPLLLSNRELREYTGDPSLSREERQRRVIEVQTGAVKLDKEKARVEREAQKIRQREQRKQDAIDRQREIEEQAEQIFTDLENRSRLEQQLRDERRIEETMRAIREENRLIDEEVRARMFKKPVRRQRPPTPIEEEEDFLEDELDELLGEDEGEAFASGIVDAPPDPEDLTTDEEDDFAEELEDFLEETPPQRTLPKIPKKARPPPTPSPTYQPPSPDNYYILGSPNTPIFDESVGETLLIAPTPEDVRRRRPPRDNRASTLQRRRDESKRLTSLRELREARVGNLSLGGSKQRYRLLDFEVRPIPNVPPSKSQPVFQELLKNNRDSRKR